METLIIIFLFGLMEGQLLRRAGTTGKKVFLNHFSLYHIQLFLLFIAVCYFWDHAYWPVLFLYALMQDIGSYIGMWTLPDKKDWINWPFYYQIFGFIPVTYLILSALYIVSRLAFDYWYFLGGMLDRIL